MAGCYSDEFFPEIEFCLIKFRSFSALLQRKLSI